MFASYLGRREQSFEIIFDELGCRKCVETAGTSVDLLDSVGRQNRDQAQLSRSPAWLNVLGILFALAAFFSDLLHISPQVAETLALGAVASFGVSGVIILRSFRKRVAAK